MTVKYKISVPLRPGEALDVDMVDGDMVVIVRNGSKRLAMAYDHGAGEAYAICSTSNGMHQKVKGVIGDREYYINGIRFRNGRREV